MSENDKWIIHGYYKHSKNKYGKTGLFRCIEDGKLLRRTNNKNHLPKNFNILENQDLKDWILIGIMRRE